MPIGDIYRFLDENSSGLKACIKQIYFIVYGISDLHSHIRWRCLKNYVESNVQTTLDVGCGSGIFLFELLKINSSIKAIGIDINEESIRQANQLRTKLELNNIEFLCIDVAKLFNKIYTQFEQVLLIDVLEHVEGDESLICNLANILKPGGSLVISVPTPNYQKFFGIDFHKKIGHVRDGYWIEDLSKILDKYGFDIVDYCYYTYYPSSILCGLFYRYILRKNKLSLLVSPIFNLLSFIDNIWPLRDKQYACSLLIKAKRRIES